LPVNSYNLCVYYNSQGNNKGSWNQQGYTGAALVGWAPFTVTTYPSSGAYGLSIASSPQGFLLGNATTLKLSALYYYTTSTGAAPDICNVGTGSQTRDICYIEFAGPVGAPGTSCFLPSATAYQQQGPYELCPTTIQASSGSFSPCILQEFSPTTYQNQQNLTYSQPLSTQYLSNGQYLLCAYDFMDIGYDDNVQYSPFSATAELTCTDGICGTVETTQPYQPPVCVSCGLAFTPGYIGAYNVNSVQLNLFSQAACGVYSTINFVLIIFALILILLGAALYAGSTILPPQSRGVLQSYAFGFIFVGIIAALIASVSVWALSITSNLPMSTVLSSCK
jgi:hypothetical protein